VTTRQSGKVGLYDCCSYMELSITKADKRFADMGLDECANIEIGRM
jgi:hypothetical protein